MNWSNIMMLGAIGLVFFLANGLGWANTNVAATFALTLLFLRTPLLQGSEPADPDRRPGGVRQDSCPQSGGAGRGVPVAAAPRPWQRIELEQVSFHYQGRAVSPWAPSIW